MQAEDEIIEDNEDVYKKSGTVPTKCTAPLLLFIVLAKRLKSLPALLTECKGNASTRITQTAL